MVGGKEGGLGQKTVALEMVSFSITVCHGAPDYFLGLPD